MKRFLPYIFILVIMVEFLLPTSFASAQTASGVADTIISAGKTAAAVANPISLATSLLTSGGGATAMIADISAKAVMNLLTFLSYVLMKLASLVLGLSALILDKVINVTILEMSNGISKMTGLNAAWKIIRDLMNIVFIFLLVYKGIMLIISQENRDSIQNFIFMIVLSSLLINFSLFFTKVIIDSSNIVTTGIYSAIVPPDSWGISTSIMKSLGIQNAWSSANLPTGTDITTEAGDTYARFSTNLLSIALFLVTAFTFLAVSAMLMVRYVILMFLLVLSPVAYMGLALNELKPHAKKWWETLMGQATFAPLFMIMMLITLKMIEGLFALGPDQYTSAGSFLSTNSGSVSTTANVLFSFSIIIGMVIGSLVMAKKYSTQGHEYASKLSGWATGKVAEYGGRAVFGSAGAISRNTVGAVASRAAQSQAFQNAAANNWFAEKALRATRRTADSSFDVRATAAGSSLASVVGGLGKAQTGGFNQALKDKISDQNSFAQSLRSDVARGNYARRIAGGSMTRQGSRSSANTIFGTMGRGNRVVASGILNTQLGDATTARDGNRTRIDQLNDQNRRLINEQSTLNAMNGGHGPAAGTPEATRLATINGPVTTRGSLLFVQNELTTANSMVTDLDRDVTDLTNEFNTLGLNNPNDIVLTPVQRRQNAAAAAAGRPLPHAGRARRADEQNY